MTMGASGVPRTSDLHLAFCTKVPSAPAAGTASEAQSEVGRQMEAYRDRFPFEFVIMVGDNMYGGSESPADFRTKFEEPYAALLNAKVKFYAALGNHDNPTTRSYEDGNMGGQRYYTFSAGSAGSAEGENPTSASSSWTATTSTSRSAASPTSSPARGGRCARATSTAGPT